MPQWQLHNDAVSVYMGPFFEFRDQLYKDPELNATLGQALDAAVDISYRVPYIAVNVTKEYPIYHIYIGRQGSFKTLSISSFGAVYANVILPIDVKLPPPAIELPPTLPSSQSPSPNWQPSPSELLKLVPKIITVFKR